MSIAIDWEEGYSRIFRYKGGDAAHGPLPPGSMARARADAAASTTR